LHALCVNLHANHIHQSVQVVEELLKYLIVADYSMREEIVLKTAVLTERFFPSLEWYVDSMLTLIERAGEVASKDVWCAYRSALTTCFACHRNQQTCAMTLCCMLVRGRHWPNEEGSAAILRTSSGCSSYERPWVYDSVVEAKVSLVFKQSSEWRLSSRIWNGRFSTVQLITNHEELHVYAAGKVVEGLRRGASGDALLGAAAYLLGACRQQSSAQSTTGRADCSDRGVRCVCQRQHCA